VFLDYLTRGATPLTIQPTLTGAEGLPIIMVGTGMINTSGVPPILA
jgi:hypothetical protein